MQFSQPYSTATEAYLRYAFQLSPSASTILAPQTSELANLRTNCDCFNISNLTDDLEVHQQTHLIKGQSKDSRQPTVSSDFVAVIYRPGL